MGIPIEPPEYGNDCPHGTPTPWAAGETPKYLIAMVTDVVSCPAPPPIHPAPPNGSWILEQTFAFPCLWTKIIGEYYVSYFIDAVSSRFSIRDIDGFLAFDDTIAGPAAEHFTNSVVCAANVNYHQGTAFVDLAGLPGTAFDLMFTKNLNSAEQSKFDVLEVPGEPAYVQVRRCGNVRTPMNVKIKTDATHKDQYEMFEA